MQFKEITDKFDWENFMAVQPWAQFNQSWIWGEFRKAQGCPVFRFALMDDNGRWLCALSGEYRAKRFGLGYWFVPRGPIFAQTVSKEDYRHLIEELIFQIQAKGHLPRALFWRWEPVINPVSEQRYLPARFFRTTSANPSSTAVLDLAKSEDDLLAGMHQKTRYNIKVAERHGVVVRVTNHPGDLDKFLKLMNETSVRDGFVQHESAYLSKTYYTLAAAHMARLRVAELNGAMLAANLEITYGDTVTYLYGASSHLMRNAMAPYALQWAAIRAAKQAGAKIYDFWGVNPELQSSYLYKPKWEGITRFKMAWGAQRIDLIGTWDLPMSLPLYRLIFFKRLYLTKP